MLVSVIVPVYNVVDYLDECISSLAAQTYSPIEILLIDDGSTDGSGDICDAWCRRDERISCYHKKNEGQGAARNDGIDRANGEYFVFVDSDDYVFSDMVDTLVKAQKSTEADSVIAGWQKVKREGVLFEERYGEHVYAGGDVQKKLLPRFVGSMPDARDSLFPGLWSKLYSRKIIREHQIRVARIRRSEDLIFQFDYFQHSEKTAIIGDVLYNYRENDKSVTHEYVPRLFEEHKKMYQYCEKEMCRHGAEELEKMRLGKFFFRELRGSIGQEIPKKSKKRMRVCLQEISDILNDPMTEDILSHYPVHRLKLSQRCFCQMVRHKCKRLLLSYFWIEDIIKGGGGLQ